MPYPAGFTDEEWIELRAIASEVGRDGTFTANDYLFAYVEHREATQGGTTEGYNARPVTAGSVAQILKDLCDLGDLRSLGGNPPRWELVSDEST